MPRTDFIEALMGLKRKTKLAGRPPSEREVRGISEGYFGQASEQLAQQKQLELQERGLTQSRELAEKELGLHRERFEAEKEAAKIARFEQKRKGITMAGGAAAGAAIGSVVPGIGTVFGAIMGGAIGGSCIIVSACTSRYSYETDITRQVRDQFLGPITLSGYYTLGNIVVPWIKTSSFIKKIIKRYLVDRLIDYGECLLGYKEKPTLKTSKIVTETFLGFCYGIGKSLAEKTHKEIV